jgi:ribosome-associated protein
MTPRNLAKKIAKIADDHKAFDIRILDLRKLTSFTDYFVICSGNSDRQVAAVADAIHEDLRKVGRRPLGEEGLREGQWALMDYGDVVAHVFYKDARDYYQLERLWHDAPSVKY